MSKTVIYQILPRLWGDNGSEPVPNGSYQENGCGKFSSLDDEFLGYLKTLGVTHIWLTGIIRHASEYSCPGCSPSQVRKGRAGSPYAIVDYYDVNPYLADIADNRIDEFKLLLNRVHSSGLKTVIDFVPNHVGREYGSLGLSHPEYPVLGAGDDPSVHWKPENDFYYYPSQMLSLPVDTGFREMPAKASGNCFSPAPGINDWWDTIRLNYCDFHT
ncbi:MAG: alpha-amylase, partial [Bacteroidales bacterium]|nr:alpha-amylase [Bacteroidales bacterium]